MPWAWESSYLENVMAVSACNYLTAGISSNPAIRKDHQHMLFDLPCAERFLRFKVVLPQDHLDQLQLDCKRRKRAPFLSVRLESTGWILPTNAKLQIIEEIWSCSLAGCGYLPSSTLAISVNPSLFPVRTITVKYEIPLSACPDSCRTQNTKDT